MTRRQAKRLACRIVADTMDGAFMMFEAWQDDPPEGIAVGDIAKIETAVEEIRRELERRDGGEWERVIVNGRQKAAAASAPEGSS